MERGRVEAPYLALGMYQRNSQTPQHTAINKIIDQRNCSLHTLNTTVPVGDNSPVVSRHVACRSYHKPFLESLLVYILSLRGSDQVAPHPNFSIKALLFIHIRRFISAATREFRILSANERILELDGNQWVWLVVALGRSSWVVAGFLPAQRANSSPIMSKGGLQLKVNVPGKQAEVKKAFTEPAYRTLVFACKYCTTPVYRLLFLALRHTSPTTV